jgi:hypothetical protein
LTGSVGSRFVIEQQQSIIALPSDLFNDTYPNAELQYEARAPGGGPLPPWLEFDARSLTFTGTPPVGSRGTVEVEIVAHDQFGNQATATFQITVGRESHDLEHMLAQINVAPPAPASHPTQAGHQGNHQGDHPTDDQTSHQRDHSPRAAGRSAFSAQLRNAGPVGKILQARQMVHSVVGAAAAHEVKASN